MRWSVFMQAMSASPYCSARKSRFSRPTPCSPVMEPPSAMHSRRISAAHASARSCAPSTRPSNRMSGCRLPSPAWKTLATRMPCRLPIASMPTSASPSRLRGTTPSWTMKSGLRRPTAEKADLRPFHIAIRSAAFCAMRTL
jgi:hypothetical protein